MTERKRIFRGDRLKWIREKRGLTQEELNQRLGFGGTQTYRYETGRADPSTEVLGRLATELGVTTDWLLGLVDEPHEHITMENLSPTEHALISAYRRGDFRHLMKIVAEEPAEESAH